MSIFGTKSKIETKIAFVSPHDYKGGASKIAYHLFNGFRERGYKVRYFVGKKSLEDKNIEQIIPYTNKFLGKLFRFINRELGIENFYYPNSSKSLIAWKPDLIHFHNIQGNYFDLRELKKISKNIPVVFTLHDTWMFTGHCSYFIECDRWKTGCGKCPDLKRRPSIKRDNTAFNWNRKKKVYRNSKFYVTTPSNWLLEQAKHSILKNGMRMPTLINNGVDHQVFKPMDATILRQKLNIEQDEIVLLYVVSSNLISNPYKDFNTISKCITFIEKNNESKKKFTLIAIGEKKPETYENGVRKLYIDYLTKAENIADYFSIADLYLHAARAENYPNVVMEALSSGTPCIVTKTGGVPEQIIENKTGWVVDYEDYKSMALKVLELSVNPIKLTTAGYNARKWIIKHHKIKNMIDKYENFYKSVLINQNE